ncbi:unnamed protein product [Chrysodeixis includens]|uniref:Pheromone binding protein 2 n=1 Tax=Chrysodeixis includens TaxID=689277 RepID=A0A9N8KYH4_CHRIL|nr:unnamed protein product [Chrysodeixis includens]
MADSKWRFVSLLCVALMANGVMSSKELLSKMSTGFNKVVDGCKSELKVGDHIMQDMYNFWREEYELVNRELGCMILCMAGKLGLLGDDQKLHHVNAADFAKSHGADDDTAKQLVTIIHDCEKANEALDEACSRALEVSKCFKTKIHELNWAPSFEVMMQEVMSAV